MQQSIPSTKFCSHNWHKVSQHPSHAHSKPHNGNRLRAFCKIWWHPLRLYCSHLEYIYGLHRALHIIWWHPWRGSNSPRGCNGGLHRALCRNHQEVRASGNPLGACTERLFHHASCRDHQGAHTSDNPLGACTERLFHHASCRDHQEVRTSGNPLGACTDHALAPWQKAQVILYLSLSLSRFLSISPSLTYRGRFPGPSKTNAPHLFCFCVFVFCFCVFVFF